VPEPFHRAEIAWLVIWCYSRHSITLDSTQNRLLADQKYSPCTAVHQKQQTLTGSNLVSTTTHNSKGYTGQQVVRGTEQRRHEPSRSCSPSRPPKWACLVDSTTQHTSNTTVGVVLLDRTKAGHTTHTQPTYVSKVQGQSTTCASFCCPVRATACQGS
jgi:hypothetical protein